jgi:alpha-beta hydrolase superfamily lysophospholipase
MMAVVLGTVWPTLSLLSGLVPATLSRDPKVVEAYVQDPLVHNKITTGCGKLMLDVIALAFARAAEFPVPFLLMHGGEDKLGFPSGSQEFAARAGAKGTLKIWPGLYHEIHNEPEKEQVFQVMLDWLAKH